ncbi:MAG: hypothetical protein KTM48_04010, partial [Wolbachia endosymbiont of Pissodes strobi]|nr:hypothetical protein [Wolbachia endosymbiont of Pissodes strobi]
WAEQAESTRAPEEAAKPTSRPDHSNVSRPAKTRPTPLPEDRRRPPLIAIAVCFVRLSCYYIGIYVVNTLPLTLPALSETGARSVPTSLLYLSCSITSVVDARSVPVNPTFSLFLRLVIGPSRPVSSVSLSLSLSLSLSPFLGLTFQSILLSLSLYFQS